jgi:zinc transport system ATP-binding protein
MTDNSILRAENISFSYDGLHPVLKDVSFSINAGESLGVLGPNGGGKSTLMKIIAGLLKLKSGNIFFNNTLSTNFNNYPYHFFSYVPQNSELNTTLPVNVSEYMEFTSSLSQSSKNNLNNDELLNLVGMLEKKQSLISSLSGGERQRVLIARSLINSPQLILLDEPTKGLDSNGQDQLLSIIQEIQNKHKTAIMIVDHNINQIIKNCHKILCLNRSLHWHDHKEMLTKDVLENIYHCEFEHLLIHEKDLSSNQIVHDHQFCEHNHSHQDPHSILRGKK